MDSSPITRGNSKADRVPDRQQGRTIPLWLSHNLRTRLLNWP
jgi:hypothetical protein